MTKPLCRSLSCDLIGIWTKKLLTLNIGLHLLHTKFKLGIFFTTDPPGKLARGLSILFLFVCLSVLNKQLFVSLIFSIIFLFQFYLFMLCITLLLLLLWI